MVVGRIRLGSYRSIGGNRCSRFSDAATWGRLTRRFRAFRGAFNGSVPLTAVGPLPSSLPPPLWVETEFELTTQVNVARFEPRGQGGWGGGGRPRARPKWCFAFRGSNNAEVVTTAVPVRSSREPPPPRPPCPRPGGVRTNPPTKQPTTQITPGRPDRGGGSERWEVPPPP